MERRVGGKAGQVLGIRYTARSRLLGGMREGELWCVVERDGGGGGRVGQREAGVVGACVFIPRLPPPLRG